MKASEKLLQKYTSGEADPQQEAIVEKWYADLHVPDTSGLTDSQKQQQLEYIRQNLPGRDVQTVRLWPRIAIAVAIASILFGAGLFFYKNHQQELTETFTYKNDIGPGKAGATLTLANGKKIHLSDAKDGELAKETGVTITKTKDGQLVYEVFDKTVQPRNEATTYNTLSTANGEQYMVILPDLTKVWLNAASSIKFPATFTGLNKRKIELRGEAYFQVKHNSTQPFLVLTKNQIVEDIGTAFNINSYDDEVVVKTTLVEGSARVTLLNDNQANGRQIGDRHPIAGRDLNAAVLTPGKQSQLNINGVLQITQADTESDLAWKNGDFIFKDEKIESIMRKLARWYNIDVVYEGDLPKNTFIGEISRYKNISAVLTLLQQTKGVHFKIEGRKVTVTK